MERCEERGWKVKHGLHQGIWAAGYCEGVTQHLDSNKAGSASRCVSACVCVTDRRRLGVLRPDTGLREPDVSRSSADDQDERS